MWSGFSTMLVWMQENIWNRVLLERGTNPFIGERAFDWFEIFVGILSLLIFFFNCVEIH